MNLQIFAYTEHPDFHALLEVECRDMTGIRPVVHTTMEELKGMVQIFQSIDVIIIDEPEDKAARKELVKYLLDTQDRFKRIYVLGENIIAHEKLRCYPRMGISELFEDLKQFVNPSKKEHDGWTAIPLMTLLHFESLPFDLHVKLPSGKLLKRVPAFEAIDPYLIKDYRKRGITDLYCEKKHNRDFSMMLINNMINRVERHYDNISEKIQAKSEVYLTTKEIVHHLGLSSRVVEVCESAIERITQDISQTNDQFGKYIRELKSNSSLAFQYRLIELTGFISGQIIDDMNFFAKNEQIKKLVFASFFCDMNLNNNQLLNIRRADQLDGLNLEEHKEVSFHALRASELVATYKNTPKEVSIIVRQHHGSFSGIGFPTQKSTELLPLSKIFLVAQDLAYDILSEREKSSLEVLRSFVQKHQNTGLQDLLLVLEGGMSKNFKESA